MVRLDLHKIAKGLDITKLHELLGVPCGVFKRIVTEEEFQELQKMTDTSSFRYLWRKTSIGAPPGKVLDCLAKTTKPARRDTDHKKKIEEVLQSLGLVEYQDYVKQYLCHNFWLDFAFPKLKLAIKPGARY